MQNNQISTTRFVYRTTGTLTSITTSISIGSSGGFLGAFAGLVVGSGFTVGEMVYDCFKNTIVPQFTQVSHAFENGWRPSR